MNQLPALEFPSNYVNPKQPRRVVRALRPGELPERGAHLVTPWLGFAHHGIYAGDGRVIHYGALMYDIIRKPVEEVSIEQFAEGRPVFVVEHGEACLHTDEVLSRARSRLGEKRYRLFTNNCEHFAEWCLHGVARSFQAETALSYPTLLGEWMRGKVLAFVQRVLAVRVPARVRLRGPR
jgi:hypothetical protein